jgi:arginase family enzyme
MRSIRERGSGTRGPLLADGDTVLVLGGNCTIALAVIAGLQRLDAGPPGLLYVDRHFDLNTPDSTTDGALDWMGLAHAFALSGTDDSLTDAFGHRPLLQPTQVAWLGVDPRLRAPSIGELNPTRSAGEPGAIPRLIRMLAATLSATAASDK